MLQFTCEFIIKQQLIFINNLQHKKMKSNAPFVISPATLPKLSPADSTWLCTYIEALERQNRTKNQQQIIMDRYIENLRAEMDEMVAADIERKNRENYLNNQINRLFNDNQILLGELRIRDEKIAVLSQQLDNLKKINLQTHEQRVNIQNQYKEHLNKIIQQSKRVQINRTQQLNKILSLNSELNEKCRKFELNFAEAVQKSSKLQDKNNSLSKQIIVIRQQLSQANRKLEQNTHMQKMKSVEIANMNEYIKQIEITNKQLMQENKRIYQGLQKDQKSRELFERQSSKKLRAYEAEIQEWKNRHAQLEQFLDFVKQNIKDMQNTIQEQNKNIKALSKSNTNLRNEILRNIMNLADETQKQRQLNQIKMELASCKGKLAENSRMLSSYSSQVITPFDQYSLKIKLKHDDTDEDTRSKGTETFSERNKKNNQKGNPRKTNFHGSQNFIING